MQEDIRDRYKNARRDYTVPSQEPKPQPTAPVNPKQPKKNRKRLFISLVILLLLAAAAAGAWIFSSRNKNSLPSSATKNVGFAIYYPSTLPTGYRLDKPSAKFQTNVLFFNFVNHTSKISVSEQAAPKKPPDFDALMKFNPSFKSLNVLGGKAIYGTSQNQPISFLLTNTTLVNTIATKGVPLDTIARLTQSLSSQ